MTRVIGTTDRERLREWIPPRYSAAGHLVGMAAAGAVGVALLAAHAAGAVHPADLVAVPVTLLVGSLLEYVAHRWLMHVPRGWLRLAWEAHTGRHHHFFRRDAPTWEHARDIWLILFSPLDVGVLVAILAAPVAALSLVLSRGAWALTVATMIAYFLAYEGLHLVFHLPAGHPLLALPGVGALRDRHLRHHDLGDTHANYGITNAVWDVVFGTERSAPA